MLADTLLKYHQAAMTFLSARCGNWWSLARIALWTILAFWALDRFYDSEKPIESLVRAKGKNFLCINTTFLRPEGFIDNIPEKSPQKTRVAWIAGSSVKISSRHHATKASYIQHLMQKSFVGKFGSEAEFFLYIFGGGRMYDKYLAILHAIEQKPDVMVITLNPVWDYNDMSITNYECFYPSYIKTGGNSVDEVAVYLALTKPHHIAEGVIRRFCPGIIQRYPDIGRTLSRKIYNPQTKAKAARRPEPPFLFWIYNETGAGNYGVKKFKRRLYKLSREITKARDPHKKSELKLARAEVKKEFLNFRKRHMQYNFMKTYFNRRDGSLCQLVLEMMFRRMHESGMPTLFYVAPISPVLLKNEKIRPLVNRMNDILRKEAGKYPDSNIRLYLPNPDHGIGKDVFRDHVHLLDGSPFAKQLDPHFLDVCRMAGAAKREKPQ